MTPVPELALDLGAPSLRVAGAGTLVRRVPLTLEDVYREQFAFVYRKAQRIGGPGIDADDVAQEVFLVVARKLDTYDGSCAITTWLYGIVLNCVRSARRRARYRSLFERGGPSIDDGAIPVDTADVEQARRIAHAILDKMSPKLREVFLLAEFEELGGDEIARIVGCKVETVWSRLHAARKEFARRLAKRGLGGPGK